MTFGKIKKLLAGATIGAALLIGSPNVETIQQTNLPYNSSRTNYEIQAEASHCKQYKSLKQVYDERSYIFPVNDTGGFVEEGQVITVISAVNQEAIDVNSDGTPDIDIDVILAYFRRYPSSDSERKQLVEVARGNSTSSDEFIEYTVQESPIYGIGGLQFFVIPFAFRHDFDNYGYQYDLQICVN